MKIVAKVLRNILGGGFRESAECALRGCALRDGTLLFNNVFVRQFFLNE